MYRDRSKFWIAAVGIGLLFFGVRAPAWAGTSERAFRDALRSQEIPVGCLVRAYRKQQPEFDRRCQSADRLMSTLRSSYLKQRSSTVSDIQQKIDESMNGATYSYGAVLAAALVRDSSLLPSLEHLKKIETQGNLSFRYARRVIERTQTGRCSGEILAHELEICTFEDPMIEQARLLGNVR